LVPSHHHRGRAKYQPHSSSTSNLSPYLRSSLRASPSIPSQITRHVIRRWSPLRVNPASGGPVHLRRRAWAGCSRDGPTSHRRSPRPTAGRLPPACSGPRQGAHGADGPGQGISPRGQSGDHPCGCGGEDPGGSGAFESVLGVGRNATSQMEPAIETDRRSGSQRWRSSSTSRTRRAGLVRTYVLAYSLPM
jgi:hypothetical protein